jgi:hypothetical protein
MKTILLYKFTLSILYFFGSLFLISCEDVIKLNLESVGSKIVIESVVTDNNKPFIVKISKSQDFYNQADYETADNAMVIISNNNGFCDTLANIGNGTYSCDSLHGIIGNTYKLEVINDGIAYQAINTLPLKTELEALDFEWVEYPHTKGYLVNIYFTDYPGIQNFYRIKVWVNNDIYKNEKVGLEYLLYDDKIFDGKKTKLPALRGSRLLNAGDTVTIELYSLSKETYDYYNTLQNIIAVDRSTLGQGKIMIEGSSAPANPVTNFNNGALGYFGAYCLSRKTIVINPEN